MTEDLAITQTRRWVQEIVAGLNLCPFAHKPLAAGTISYRLSQASAEDDLYLDLLNALEAFLGADSRAEETGFLICPRGLLAFDDYNQFLDVVDAALSESQLESQVQVASFHPDYQFADSAQTDPANFTNRSPYPMFHFIRQSLLTEALRHFPDPAAIPQRNIALLRKMGWREMQSRLQAIRISG